MFANYQVCVSLAFLLLGACALATDVPRTVVAPVIDGDPSDAAWGNSPWRNLDQLMVGEMPKPADFTGRYKLVWTEDFLFLLAEITDDVLIDARADPFEFYWEDDTLEVFVDADASGGPHQFDYNAFAYHIALDNQSVDIGPFRNEADRDAGKMNIRAFPDHVTSLWRRSLDDPHTIFWEVRISVFGDDYHDDNTIARPLTLRAGQKLGFMVAYCDADTPEGREHFMGDVEIEPVNGDRNLGYIDASVFGVVTLTDQNNKPIRAHK